MKTYDTEGRPPAQPDNPTDQERYAMAHYALAEVGRSEDLPFIRKYLSPAEDICDIAACGSCKGVRVGIIGAGLAGLSAAFELRKLGCDVTVLEADPRRIGGRVYTYHFGHSRSLYGELGAMRIPVTHEAVWHYINLFNLPTTPFIQNCDSTIINMHGISVRNDPDGANAMKYIYPCYPLAPWERQTSWQQLYYLGVDSHLLEATPEARSQLVRTMADYDPIIDYFDEQSLLQMMRRSGLSEGAIDILTTMSPLTGSNLYHSYVDIAQAEYPVNLSYLYTIPGGMSNLTATFAQSFADPNCSRYYPATPQNALGSVSIRCGAQVCGIAKASDRQVLLTYREGRSVVAQPFDYVICTVPFSCLRTIDVNPLFSDRKMRAIREVNYNAAQKTLFLCRRKFWQEKQNGMPIFGGGSYTDLPIVQTWYPSDDLALCGNTPTPIPYGHHMDCLRPKGDVNAAKPGVLIASYNYTLNTYRLAGLPREERNALIKRYVEQVHCLRQGYLDDIVEDAVMMDWNQYPFTRGALCYYTPGQKQLFSFAMAMPEYDETVFFAGEHIAATHRWMQGSLQTGMEAANQVAASCRKRRK